MGKRTSDEKNSFPVVGIGASAGGLEPLKKFFSRVEKDSGMAYIVVVHMHPSQPSMMAEILQRTTDVSVKFIEDGEKIVPDCVYVIPPDRELSLYRGELHLLELVRKNEVLPIDFFFRSLARDRTNMSAGIVLSGTGTDGSLGLKEIKDNDGIVLVQSPETAEYDGMPLSALETDLADKTLEVEEMPSLLKEYFENRGLPAVTEHAPPQEKENWLHKIFALLTAHTGHDFSVYKRSTILRRIYRRMGLNQIEDHETYITFLREESVEIYKLFQELLIGVTNFFRDAESFETLKEEVLPKLLSTVKEDSEFRIWVPGCSTGEEVYSLAIILQEHLEEHPKRVQVQFFGTDIDQQAIKKAREGLYPAGISADLSGERLSRFFTQEGSYYRIRKDIREKIVFSVQDVIKDPPFLRIHLLCCRNLLIYLDGETQKKLLPLFHYAVNPEGILMLGSSESLGKYSNLFQPISNKWKIFKRREVPQSIRGTIDFPTGVHTEEKKNEQLPAQRRTGRSDFEHLTREALLDLTSPASVLVDRKGTILYVHGRTGKYLEPASGHPSNNITDMAREGLRFDLSYALRRTVETNEPVERPGLRIKTNGDEQTVDLSVYPVEQPQYLEGTYLVVFRDVESAPARANGGEEEIETEAGGGDRKIRELEKELESTRESQRTTVEELESANEELKSTNEELQSSNEELQSTNEELESSKEELQSLNEELHTVNSELQSKIEELSAAHDDMNNLLNGIEVAAVFLDNDMRIKRFTEEAKSIINLIHTDIGRPLTDMGTNIESVRIVEEIREVLDKLIPRETEVKSTAGNWYLMKILPYRTSENRIDGSVLTFLDIDDQKKAQQELERLNREKEQERMLIRKVFDENSDPLAVLDSDGRIIIANSSFHSLMNLGSEVSGGADILSVENEVLARTDLKGKLRRALKEGSNFVTEDFGIDQRDEVISYRISGHIIQNAEGEPYRILLVFERR